VCIKNSAPFAGLPMSQRIRRELVFTVEEKAGLCPAAPLHLLLWNAYGKNPKISFFADLGVSSCCLTRVDTFQMHGTWFKLDD
jgi:hypothetical protein